MGKHKIKLELYFLIHSGKTIKELVAMGYSIATVYNYTRRYKEMLKEFPNIKRNKESG